MKASFNKANFMKHALFGLAFTFLVSLASAKELKSDQLNYVFTMPDGWTVTFENAAGFSVASPDGMKTMTLVVRNSDYATLDTNSIAAIEKGLLKAGAKKISSRNFEVDGVPAYEIILSVGKTPFASSFVTHLTIANNKLYNLQAVHVGGNVTRDSEIIGALASFHFLQRPKS